MVERINQIFLGILVAWVPVAFFYRAADGFTLTKEVPAALALAYFAVLVAAQGRGLLRLSPFQWALLFLAWMAGDSLAVGLLKMEVLKGSVHLILLVGTFLAVVYACSRGTSYVKLLHLALLAGGILALYGIAQSLGLDRSHWDTKFEQRAFATLGNPDYLGGYLAGLLPLSFILTLRTPFRERWLLFRALTLAVFAALLLTRARGSYLALGASALLMVLAFLLPWGRALFKRNVIFIVISFGILVVGAGAYLERHGGWSAFSVSQASVQQRVETYKVAWEMIKENTWFGIGLGQVGVQYPRYQFKPYVPADYPRHPYVYTEHIHNEFLQFWVEGGLPGLLLFLGLLAAFGWSLVKFLLNPETRQEDKELSIGVVGGLVALLVQSLSNFPLQVAPTAVLFGLYLAAPLALKHGTVPNPSGKIPAILKAALVLAPLIVGMIGIRAVGASIAFRNTVGETNLGKGNNAFYFGTRLTGLSPLNPKAWNVFGKALELAGQKDTALEAYGKSLDLNPNFVENDWAMAELQVGLGRFDQALDTAQKGLAVVPNYAALYFPLGVGYFQTGKLGESAKAFEQCLAYNPYDFQALLDLGVCDIKLGSKTDALAAWQRAHQVNPTDPQTIQYMKSLGVQPKP